MDNSKIQAKFNQIRNLEGFRSLPKDQVWEKAEKFVKRDDEAFELITKFKDYKEKKFAKVLLYRYLDDFSNVTISDKNILKDLIYYEVVQLRLQKKLNDLTDRDNAVPTNLLDTLHANSEMILSLKSSLNLFSKKEQKNSYDVLENLKKKFKIWRKENQASRYSQCPHCGKAILWKIRPEHWELQKHPFFKDRIIYNKHLALLYEQKKITREDFAKILEVSPYYIDWVLSKVKK